MRLIPLLVLALFGADAAWAADAPPARARLTPEQRFAQADTSGDGRLTLEEAKRGYRSVARNFPAIDTGGKGYVTLEEVLAWQKAQREARAVARQAAEDPLRPRPAMQRGATMPTQVTGPRRGPHPLPPVPETPAEP